VLDRRGLAAAERLIRLLAGRGADDEPVVARLVDPALLGFGLLLLFLLLRQVAGLIERVPGQRAAADHQEQKPSDDRDRARVRLARRMPHGSLVAVVIIVVAPSAPRSIVLVVIVVAIAPPASLVAVVIVVAPSAPRAVVVIAVVLVAAPAPAWLVAIIV